MGPRKHPYAKCEECPLREGGTYVPSAGPEQAEIAVVGEAPGYKEAAYGEPFVGPSGQLLERVMDHHGLSLAGSFRTNAVLCRPKGNATPPPAAISACRQRLLMELEERGVSQVVALGNTAAQSLLGRTGITKLRIGPGRGSPDLPGVRVVPTIHPAACLRQGDQFPHLVTDIGKLRYKPNDWTPPNIIVVDNRVDALRELDRFDEECAAGEGVVVLDIEVDVEKDEGGFGHPNQYGMLCVGIACTEERVLVLGENALGEEEVFLRLGNLLRKYRIIAQNGKFDLAGLYPHIGGLQLWFDTMLASYVFDERPGVHGLKYQAVEYLGAPQYDEVVKRYVGNGGSYSAIPRDILYEYNGIDVACTFALYRMWSLRFDQEDPSLRRVHDFLVLASNELMYLELNGIAVDRSYLKVLDTEYRGRLIEIEDKIDKQIHGSINPRSPLQIKKYLKEKGIDVDSTNEDTMTLLGELLEKKIERGEEGQERWEEVLGFVQLLLTHRREAKLHGTYVKGIAKRLYRGRVYSTFLLHGTTTGRLASRNPNVQNIPRQSTIRRLFVPSKEETVFLQSDYSQAELRVLSYLARDTYFRAIFNAGDIDVFDDLSAKLYPKQTELYYSDQLTKAEWKELRIRVKAFVYGLGYGREAASIAKEYKLSMSEAFRLRNEFFEVIPEIVAFQAAVKHKVHMGEDLITPWGRHRRFPLITKENVHKVMNEALAFLPQSTASDMTLQALIWSRPELKGIAWIRNIVHDSLLVECYPEDVPEVKRIIEGNMIKAAESIVGDYVKFAVDTKVGKHWGEV